MNFMEVIFALLVSTIVVAFGCLSMTTAIQVTVKTNDILSAVQQLQNGESYILAGINEPSDARADLVRQVESTHYPGVFVVKLEVLTANVTDAIYIPTLESFQPSD